MRELENHEKNEYSFTEEERWSIENADQKDKEAIKKSISEFNTKHSKLADYDKQSNTQLQQHASVNSGFHDYEHQAYMTKQKLRDFCELYRVFFENDPMFSDFLKEMREYAELDPYSDENYKKEVKFVKELPGKIARLEKALEKQENRLKRELQQVDSKAYNKLSKKEKRKLDHKLIIKSETLDNRKRALASFSYFFENQTKGDLSDFEALSEENQEKINKMNAQTGLTKPKHMVFTDKWKGHDFDYYYINASGVKLDPKYSISATYRNDGFWAAANKAIDNLDFDSDEADMRDAPIFPHEPRMTDVDQADTGACYMYSGLSEVARLYPQKIKDMIRDNGDGTATVRFFATKEDITGQRHHFPVYVRVDKTMPRHNTNERMAHNSLWVNLIEKAYAMSGLHASRGTDYNFPIDPDKPENKDWKPAIRQIEGGFARLFLENILGDDGEGRDIFCPSPDQVNADIAIAKMGFTYDSKSELFYREISDALDKGLPVTFCSIQDAQKIQGNHAYSLIGAFKTEDTPPRYIFRLKNPWTDRSDTGVKNGIEYVKTPFGISSKWVNVKDGIFDIELTDLAKDCDRFSITGGQTLAEASHQEVEGYNITSPKNASEFDKTHITADDMTDLMKAYNELYDSLVSTNSVFSHDSEEYTNLLDGLKDFRHNLAQSFGKNKSELKKMTKPLLKLVKDYEDHVDGQFFGESQRQSARKNVCNGIRSITKLVQKGINPQRAAERIYARKLMEQQHAKKGIKDPALLESAAKELYNNKAFRNIANSCTITSLINPTKSQMNAHLKEIDQKLNGRGLDNKVNLEKMQPQKKQPKFRLM